MFKIARGSVMRPVLFGVALLVFAASLASAQQRENRCADCHFANPKTSGLGHLLDWELSAHGREKVGCAECHGGNPAAASVFMAHLGIVATRNPKNRLSHANVSATCGMCHAGPFAAFQTSRHYALLKSGDARGPTCVTCHGESAAQLMSPAAVEGECNQCHGVGKRAPRPERAMQVRTLLERVRDLRAQLDAARRLIDAVGDPARRQRLRDEFEGAQAPLTQTVNDGHSFVFTGSEERLDTTRRRLAALYQSIVTP